MGIIRPFGTQRYEEYSEYEHFTSRKIHFLCVFSFKKHFLALCYHFLTSVISVINKLFILLHTN